MLHMHIDMSMCQYSINKIYNINLAIVKIKKIIFLSEF